MEQLWIYNQAREVPAEAQRRIEAGRLKGMTDINPMWRFKKLTELFGPCGIGWKYIIRNQKIETAGNGEIACFVDIDLYYKWEDQWSEAIPGTGGSMFVAQERNGLHTSDECFKMALTDAISVACKALGFGADVYWEKNKTKYSPQQKEREKYRCKKCGKEIKDIRKKDGTIVPAKESYEKCGRLCIKCYQEANKKPEPENLVEKLNDLLIQFAEAKETDPGKALTVVMKACEVKSLDSAGEEGFRKMIQWTEDCLKQGE